MAISFPGSKSNGQKFTHGNKSWTWNGSSWKGTTSNGGDATSLGGASATSFLRSDQEDSGIGLNLNGGSLNQANDATLYVTASNNSDWGMKIDANAASGKTEYGMTIDMPSSFSYGLRVRKNGADHFRVDSAGAMIASNYVWHAGNDGSGSGLDADLLDGQQGSYYMPASTTSINQSNQVSGNTFATTSSPGGVLEYQQASGLTDTKLAPGTDWYNSIRMGHGNPYSYYSNTIAVKMTGTGVGDLYTQTISNNVAQGWNKHWHNNNDGSGSGLDADTVDGLHASDLGGGATVSTTAPSSPSQGDMWFNSTTGVTAMYVWSGTQWDQMSNKFSATGGTVTTYAAGGLNYKIHTFTSSGTFTAEAAGVVDVLMVAGGGGGGGHANPGGAGAGGLIYINSHGLTPGTFTITVGAGGVNTNTGTYATAVKGNDTTGIGLTAKGGGAGVVWSAAVLASLNGGSSGGYGTGGSVNTGASTATQPSQSGDSGVYGFGNRGGNGTYFGNPYPGGGGGGAGAVGQNSPGGSTAGAGGAGRTYDISGTSTTYAGGGGGGGWSAVSGMAGGAGGGGRGDCALSNGSGTSSRGFTNNSSIGENGSINTGGGGGGAGRTGGQLSRGGNGGSGIVIIRYLV